MKNCLLYVFLISLAASQDWTKEQLEVKAVLDAYSQASKERNLEKYLSYWHKDFIGWHDGDNAPTTYAERRKGLQWYFTNSEVVESSIDLKNIQVTGSTAVVHYIINQTLKWSNGKTATGPSFWTDVLVKEDGKWYLYSDHGGDANVKDNQ